MPPPPPPGSVPLHFLFPLSGGDVFDGLCLSVSLVCFGWGGPVGIWQTKSYGVLN